MENENLYKKACDISEQVVKVMLREEGGQDADLKEWMETNVTAEEVTMRLADPDWLRKEVEKFVHEDKAEQVQLLRKQIRRRRNRRRIFHVTGVAAVLALFIGVTLFISNRPGTVENEVQEEHVPMLILGNGKSVNLRLAAGEWAADWYTNIKNDRKGELEYIATDTPGADEQKEVLNTLVIPRQCTYRVILSDGTVVHLNADSRLEYPVKFKGEERKVELQGEAYFEVAKDAKPFIVCVNDVQVKVYGTRFDVNSYHKNRFQVTLVEGKVGVVWKDKEKKLYPSQLLFLDSATGEQSVTNVEVDKYISWTRGYLRYDDDRLYEMMEDLSRWYGVDFEFDAEATKSMRITASINKDLPLSQVLAVIRATINITFIKQERGYLISQPF